MLLLWYQLTTAGILAIYFGAQAKQQRITSSSHLRVCFCGCWGSSPRCWLLQAGFTLYMKVGRILERLRDWCSPACSSWMEMLL